MLRESLYYNPVVYLIFMTLSCNQYNTIVAFHRFFRMPITRRDNLRFPPFQFSTNISRVLNDTYFPLPRDFKLYETETELSDVSFLILHFYIRYKRKYSNIYVFAIF